MPVANNGTVVLFSEHTADSSDDTEQDSESNEPVESDGEAKSDTPAPADVFKVNRKGFIEADGEIEELLPGLKFNVRLDNDHLIMATLAGRMRINKIMLVLGDRVRVEMSPYDLTKGRVTYRY